MVNMVDMVDMAASKQAGRQASKQASTVASS